MRISHGRKFVFLSNPRTGSTTVGRVLDPYSDIKSRHTSKTSADFPFYHHISAVKLKALFAQRGWVWEDYRRFCVVRNPFDRIVSAYHFQLNFICHGDRSLAFNARRWLSHWWRRRSSFESYVEHINFARQQNLSLLRFIGDAAGRPLVPDVLRFENLDAELPQYLRQFGIELGAEDIPRVNATDVRGEYRAYYTPKAIARVRELFAYEIERFGYQF